jgi:hypothetical protein
VCVSVRMNAAGIIAAALRRSIRRLGIERGRRAASRARARVHPA